MSASDAPRASYPFFGRGSTTGRPLLKGTSVGSVAHDPVSRSFRSLPRRHGVHERRGPVHGVLRSGGLRSRRHDQAGFSLDVVVQRPRAIVGDGLSQRHVPHGNVRVNQRATVAEQRRGRVHRVDARRRQGRRRERARDGDGERRPLAANFWPLSLGAAPADGDVYKVTVTNGVASRSSSRKTRRPRTTSPTRSGRMPHDVRARRVRPPHFLTCVRRRPVKDRGTRVIAGPLFVHATDTKRRSASGQRRRPLASFPFATGVGAAARPGASTRASSDTGAVPSGAAGAVRIPAQTTPEANTPVTPPTHRPLRARSLPHRGREEGHRGQRRLQPRRRQGRQGHRGRRGRAGRPRLRRSRGRGGCAKLRFRAGAARRRRRCRRASSTATRSRSRPRRPRRLRRRRTPTTARPLRDGGGRRAARGRRRARRRPDWVRARRSLPTRRRAGRSRDLAARAVTRSSVERAGLRRRSSAEEEVVAGEHHRGQLPPARPEATGSRSPSAASARRARSRGARSSSARSAASPAPTATRCARSRTCPASRARRASPACSSCAARRRRTRRPSSTARSCRSSTTSAGSRRSCPTEMLEKIDFYPGNFSAQYGRVHGRHRRRRPPLAEGRRQVPRPRAGRSHRRPRARRRADPGLKDWSFLAAAARRS